MHFRTFQPETVGVKKRRKARGQNNCKEEEQQKEI